MIVIDHGLHGYIVYSPTEVFEANARINEIEGVQSCPKVKKRLYKRSQCADEIPPQRDLIQNLGDSEYA